MFPLNFNKDCITNMPINFEADEFTSLTVKEKRELVVTEFTKCKNDFEYFINHYARIRHPNVGVIQMKPFDFQLDVALPISQTLHQKRSVASIESLRSFKYKFEYEKWWKNIAEKNIELSRVIPAELHNFYKVTSKHTDFNTRVDTILLKSRQTGLSTIFQVLVAWHINFNRNIYDLVMSQTDREAIKFLGDLNAVYSEIPGPLKSKLLNANEHELWCSITGDKSKRSGIQALPPTAKAGRSYSPNLVVLDEFAEYAHAEKVWTSVSMSVSAGGIIVIIATPKGVGNLYHKIWQMTNKSLTLTVSTNKTLENQVAIDLAQQALSVFRPMAVHWSQLPESEFSRRGFTSSLNWYKHMCSKISMEKGAKAIAQELDLDFAASGNTMDAKVIEVLTQNCLENVVEDIMVLDTDIPGLIVYSPPTDDGEYMLGVDTAEGVKSDSSVVIVFKLPKTLNDGVLAQVVAKYASNSISIRRFTDIVRLIGTFYNNAWINTERNNHGHVLLSYFVEDGQYKEDLILNRFDAIKSVFTVGVKGWGTQPASKMLLIATFQDYVTTYKNEISLPFEFCNELRTYIQKPDGKWTAQSGYHDDHILAYAIGILGFKMLVRYKEFLRMHSSDYSANEIDDDLLLSSSLLVKEEGHPIAEYLSRWKEKQDRKYIQKDQVDLDSLRSKFKIKKSEEKEKELLNGIKHSDEHKYVSRVIDYDDEDDFIISTF